MILGHILSHERPSSCFCAGMTPDSNLIGLAMAVGNIENLLKDPPTHVVARQG